MIHDISISIRPGMHFYPGDPTPELTRLGDVHAGDEWTSTQLSFSSHTGTHIDAPYHRLRGGNTVDRLALETLIGQAFVADLRGVRSEISASDLEQAGIPDGVTRVLCKTHNGELWRREGFQEEYVALNGESAKWLVEHGVRLIGLDYLSADVYAAGEPAAHEELLGADVVIVEGLNLADIQPGMYRLVCLPIKLEGADGAPARAVLIDE